MTRKKTILVLGSDQDYRFFHESLGQKFDILGAKSCVEARLLSTQKRISLVIICDITTPEGKNWKCARRVFLDTILQPKLIVCSDCANEEFMSEVYFSGGHVLLKPFDIGEAESAIEMAIGD